MQWFFLPAVRLLDMLRYHTKFALIGALVAVSSLFLIGKVYLQVDAQVRATESERDGLEALDAMFSAVALMQQHRGQADRMLNGDQDARTALQATASELAAKLPEVTGALARLEADERLQPAWETMAGDWSAMQRSIGGMNATESLVAHNRIIQSAFSLIFATGNASGLAFDPAPAVRNLMDPMLRSIPQLTEEIGKLRGRGAGILAKGMLEIPDDERDIAVLLGSLEVVKQQVMDSLELAASVATTDTRPRIEGAAGEIRAAVGRLGVVAREQVFDGQLGMRAGEFFTLGSRAIETVLEQRRAVMLPEVRRLLDERIARLGREVARDLIIALVLLGVVSYLFWGTYLSIVNSVNALTVGAEALGRGDCSGRIVLSARDELALVGSRFNSMASNLADLIRRVRSSSEAVDAAVGELEAVATSVKHGSLEQSQSASAMATAVQQMTVGIGEIARYAGDARTRSERAGQSAAEGGRVVKRTVEEMERIAAAVNDAAIALEQMGARSEKIGEIVNVIREVADQTNLLALNAAIEAARAGESGRGFAVVADEVRKLAERTGGATQEIGTMVAAIQQGTRSAIDTMRHGVDRVEAGVALTRQAGSAIEAISSGAEQVVAVISEISEALREQSNSSDEIARSVERIARMAEENSNAVHEADSATARLKGMSGELRLQIGHFTA